MYPKLSARTKPEIISIEAYHQTRVPINLWVYTRKEEDVEIHNPHRKNLRSHHILLNLPHSNSELSEIRTYQFLV